MLRGPLHMAPPNARPAARSAPAKKGSKPSSAGSHSARKSPTSQSNSSKNAKGKPVQTVQNKGAKSSPKGSKGASAAGAAKPAKGGGSTNGHKGSKSEVKHTSKPAPTAPKAAESKAHDPKAGKSKPASSEAAPVAPKSSHAVIAPKPAGKGKKKAEKAPPPRKMFQPALSTGPALVKSPPPSAISRPGPAMVTGPRPASMMPPPPPVIAARPAAGATGPNGKPAPAPPPPPNRPPRLSPFAVTAPIMPVQTKPLKLKMGDKAVHPKHGLGEVIAVEERELGGMKGEFYVLRILDNGMRVMVPVSSPSGLRSVMSPKEADGVLDTMRAREVAVDLQPWSRRFRAYTEMIKSGSPHEVAKVLRDMYRLKFDKDLSFGERRLLDQAKSLLMKELAAAKGMTEAALNEQVAKMFQA